MITHWRHLPEKSVLDAGNLRLWLAWLDEESPEQFKEDLSADERARAARLRSPKIQHRFIASRGILRRILGSYLGLEPGQLVFTYGAQGKPALGGAGDAKLSFNLSHSGSLVVYAVSSGMDVGVDIEQVHLLSDLDATAATILSTPELAELQALPPAERMHRFFTLWTCKEAVLKAAGSGLTHPTKDVHIHLHMHHPQPDSQTVILSNGQGIQLMPINPAPGYVGALACIA